MTAKQIRPEFEALDRDPGIISLLAAVARLTGRGVVAGARAVHAAHRGTGDAEALASSSAWPSRHRAH